MSTKKKKYILSLSLSDWEMVVCCGAIQPKHICPASQSFQIYVNIVVLPLSLGQKYKVGGQIQTYFDGWDKMQNKMQKKVQHTAGKRYMCLPCKANLSYTSKVEARKETILPQILLLFQPVLPVNVCCRNVMRMQKQKCRNPYELLAEG